MNFDNEELVTDVTENVEETTEELTEGANAEGQEPVAEQPKGDFYTEEQIKDIKFNAMRRGERKVRKDLEKKYGRLENVLKAGTGESELDKITEGFETYYESKGKKIPQAPQYSQRDMEILANAEAEDIISSGYDDIVEEVDRLADIGVDNMTPQEKLIFSKLAKERTRIEDEKELASIGVTELSDDFKAFAKNLNPSLSTKEKYEMYLKFNPKKEVKPMGSMKSGQMNKVKDYYTEDEISRMSLDDLSDPQVWEAVRKSMTGQK